jgi:head-tail adaptor
MIRAGDLDREITFQRRTRPATDQKPDPMAAGEAGWADFATVRAQVQEMLPSRGERLADGLAIANRPARLRMWFRDDITADMQIRDGARTLQIMAPPVELGRRQGLELMVQDLSTSGSAA